MRHLFRSLLCLVVIMNLMACTPKLVGPTVSTGYFFTVLHPNSILLRTSTEIIVKVQDAAGQPVDGISVMFEVDASWSGDATINPARVFTQKGVASAVFQVGVLGLVPIWVTVDGTRQQTVIGAEVRGDVPSGA